MPEKILVTGGTGFVGREVVELLARSNRDVHVVTRSRDAFCGDGVVVHGLDIFDAEGVSDLLRRERFDTLLHLAWYVGKGCHSSDENLPWAAASVGLLREFVDRGGSTFLGAGTVSEYEYKYGYLVEDQTPTSPSTIYGEAKNAVYKVAKPFCAKHGVAFKWPRIFNLYGPREKPSRLMPSVIGACLSGEDVLVSDCLKFQDYLYVKDTAMGIVKTLDSDLSGAVNVCSGEPVQLKAIVNTIAELTNFHGEIKWGAIPPAFDYPVVVGSNEKLRSSGWQPSYTLESGLKETIEWARACQESCHVQ